MKPRIILSLIAVIICIVATPASAGTWSDGFKKAAYRVICCLAILLAIVNLGR